MYHSLVTTPIGSLLIEATDKGVRSINWVRNQASSSEPNKWSRLCATQLKEYLAGERSHFNFPFDLKGTPFQLDLWQKLYHLKSGDTVTYGQLAAKIKRPKAVRAVGTAVGKNPLAVVIPCHRVLPSSGKLGNYASGPAKKQWLLEHEQVAI